MRLRARWFVVGIMLTLIGCASTTPPSAPSVAKSTMDEACGDPVRWPVSRECVNLLGPRGSLFQEKSDLVMALWRACPTAAPCGNFEACKKLQSLKVGTKEYESQRAACKSAQMADYSCSALQRDLEFQRQGRVASECLKNVAKDASCNVEKQHLRVGSKRWKKASAERIACYERCLPGDSTSDCKQAQAHLANFEDRIQKEPLDQASREALVPLTNQQIAAPAVDDGAEDAENR